MTEKIKQFSVVDVETTGFGRGDKICEIAIVSVNAETLEITDEFETLINPQRDLGPVHIHKVTPGMVVGAPTFEQVASGIAQRLNQSVLVAHNISFDRRMIAQEFERVRAIFDPGCGVCTLNLTGEKLFLAAQRFGINYATQHRALDDARVTAHLFQLLFEEHEKTITPMRISQLSTPPCAAAVVRETATADSAPNESLIEQICKHTRFPTSEADILQYLDLLNSILADLVVDAAEQKQINDLMKTLGLSSNDIKWANEVYLQTLIAGAKRDGIITEREKEIMDVVAKILDVQKQPIPSVTDEVVCANYPTGTRVCFTGTAVGADQQEIKRRVLEAESAKRGLQPVDHVTKKGCDLLVAQDVQSASGKAQKARDFGIEMISVNEFLVALGSVINLRHAPAL